VKGYLSALKGYQQVSVGDLYSVHEKVDLAVDNQMNRFAAIQASNRTRVLIHLRNVLFQVCHHGSMFFCHKSQ
jgi:hypothetical protein